MFWDLSERAAAGNCHVDVRPNSLSTLPSLQPIFSNSSQVLPSLSFVFTHVLRGIISRLSLKVGRLELLSLSLRSPIVSLQVQGHWILLNIFQDWLQHKTDHWIKSFLKDKEVPPQYTNQWPLWKMLWQLDETYRRGNCYKLKLRQLDETYKKRELL